MANEGSTKPTYEELEEILESIRYQFRKAYDVDVSASKVIEDLLRVRGLLQRASLMLCQFVMGEGAEQPPVREVYRWLGEAAPSSSEEPIAEREWEPLAKLTTPQGRDGMVGLIVADELCGSFAPWEHGRANHIVKEINDAVGRTLAGTNFRESSSLVPQGAESADIGKLDTVDKKCAYCKHTHAFQFDEIVDDDCPVVGCPCMHFLAGSAETGGEKAAGSPRTFWEKCFAPSRKPVEKVYVPKGTPGKGEPMLTLTTACEFAEAYAKRNTCTPDCEFPPGHQQEHPCGKRVEGQESREPEKLWCPECCTQSGKTEYGDCPNRFHKSLAESSLSSPPPDKERK